MQTVLLVCECNELLDTKNIAIITLKLKQNGLLDEKSLQILQTDWQTVQKPFRMMLSNQTDSCLSF